MERPLRCTGLVFICAMSLLLFASTAGCADKQLSRSSAGELIKKSEVFKSTANGKAVVGSFWYYSNLVNKDYDYDLQPLIANGMLTLRETGKSYAVFTKEYIAELTPLGQQKEKNWIKSSEGIVSEKGPTPPNAEVWNIPVAQKELIEVTGIASEANGKQAVVEFTWKWVPTSDSRLAPKKVPSGEARKGVVGVQLYDDGWRIVQSNIR